MEKAQASHQADQGALQAAMDSLQVQCRQLHSRHQHWAWQLAVLQHWKRQGALQLRKLLHGWAMLTAASRPHRSTAPHKDLIRSNSRASHMGSITGVSEAPGCREAHSPATQICCTAGAEDRMPGLLPVADGGAQHDRQVLGACFKGIHMLAEPCLVSWFLSCCLHATASSTVMLLHSEAVYTLPLCLQL